MCGRFAITLRTEALKDFFALAETVELMARYNVAPTQPVVVIRRIEGRRCARFARWGLVPGWVKDPRAFPLLVNARAETMAEKPAFRGALRYGRCIVPASGYYEWHTGPNRAKQPYYIALDSGEPMALAGLLASWRGPEGEEIDTLATITVPANEELAVIHDRMPAILRDEEIERWLDIEGTDVAAARALARPLEAGALRFHAVSPRVNSARDDDAGLIAPIVPEPPIQQSLLL